MTLRTSVLVVWLGGCLMDLGEPDDLRGDFLMVSPVYSAFDGVHEYQVPVAIESGVGVDSWEIVDDRGIVRGDVVETRTLTMVNGLLLTTKSAGDFTLVARAGSRKGCSRIHIATGTAAQWSLGEIRYRDGLQRPESEDQMDPAVSAQRAPCVDCHAASKRSVGAPSSVRTVGYSDSVLAQMMERGSFPETLEPAEASPCKSYPSSSWQLQVSRDQFQSDHLYQASPEEAASLVLYVRSLAPDFHIGSCAGCHSRSHD